MELLLFDALASGLPQGSITINAYARNFQSVVIGVAGIALAQSAFSPLSQAAAKKEAGRFWIYLKKGVGILLIMTIPGAIILVLATPLAAKLVHLERVIETFRLCLILYAISIPFESLNHLLLRAYYSLKDTMIPAFFNVMNGVVAVTISWFFLNRFGVYSLALGFTAGQIVQLIGLWVLLPRKINVLR